MTKENLHLLCDGIKAVAFTVIAVCLVIMAFYR